VDSKKIPKINCKKYANFLKLEISYWKKFLISQFTINNSYIHHECFQESYEIINWFLENSAELLQLFKQDSKNINKNILKKVLEIRAKSEKTIKIKN